MVQGREGKINIVLSRAFGIITFQAGSIAQVLAGSPPVEAPLSSCSGRHHGVSMHCGNWHMSGRGCAREFTAFGSLGAMLVSGTTYSVILQFLLHLLTSFLLQSTLDRIWNWRLSNALGLRKSSHFFARCRPSLPIRSFRACGIQIHPQTGNRDGGQER